MAYQFNLAKDQHLRGASNFSTRYFLIMTAARWYGMEEFIEEDVISHLKDNNYRLNPNEESKTVSYPEDYWGITIKSWRKCKLQWSVYSKPK